MSDSRARRAQEQRDTLVKDGSPWPFLVAGTPAIALVISSVFPVPFRVALGVVAAWALALAWYRRGDRGWSASDLLDEVREVPEAAAGAWKALSSLGARTLKVDVLDPFVARSFGNGAGSIYFVLVYFVVAEETSGVLATLFAPTTIALHFALNALATCDRLRRQFEGKPIERYDTRVACVLIRQIALTWVLSVAAEPASSPLFRATAYYAKARWASFALLATMTLNPIDATAAALAHYGGASVWLVAGGLAAYNLRGLQFETCANARCSKTKKRDSMLHVSISKVYCHRRCRQEHEKSQPTPACAKCN